MMANYIKKILLISMLLIAVTAHPQEEDALEDEYGNRYDGGGKIIFFNDESGNETQGAEDDPGTGEEGGGTVEDPPAPIDGHLPYLAIGGILLAGYYLKSKKATAG